MDRIRTALDARKLVLALLALLAVIAHVAPVMLLASSFTPIQVFNSRSDLLGELGPPQLSYNFTNVADQQTTLLNLGGLTIAGDLFRVQSEALDFAVGSNETWNFASGATFWGADFTPIGGSGLIDISVEGLSTLVNLSSPEFIGFATASAFRSINVSFLPNLASGNLSTASNLSFVVDNVIANAVPEPTTLLLLATGAGLLGLSYRRQKRSDDGDTGHDGGQADPM
jgi:hypothetical protein